MVLAETPPLDAFRASNPGTDSFRVERYPFYLLNRLVARYNQVIEARLRSIGLDIPSWRVLMILGEKSPRGARVLAQSAVIPISTMTRIVQRMEAATLVVAAPDPDDGRITLVDLTPMGRDKLAEARRETAPVFEHLVAGFDIAEFERLIEMLGRLHHNLAPLA